MLKWPEWPANGPAFARKLRQGRRELTRKGSSFDQADRLERRLDFSITFFILIVAYAFLLRLSWPGVKVNGCRLAVVDPSGSSRHKSMCPEGQIAAEMPMRISEENVEERHSKVREGKLNSVSFAQWLKSQTPFGVGLDQDVFGQGTRRGR